FMLRFNPGPFEPFVYLLQTPVMFRVVGLGGLVLFSILAFSIAGAHGVAAVVFGLVLIGALWYETSANVCRRCRFYGKWHCLGQGMLASKLFSPIDERLGESGTMLHGAILAAYLIYGLFWLWHEPMIGFIFTLWIPIALITATTPAGFSWRALKPS
ncbi:hypothetical protein, partial [Candidatus Binatus sp.]|uniref:hypothetical protein n=2 Tax=Candidatus Binatus sp. TaxID=2811406 RepID=UPI003CC58124